VAVAAAGRQHLWRQRRPLHRRIAEGKLSASRFGVRLIRVRAEDVDRLYRRVPSATNSRGGADPDGL